MSAIASASKITFNELIRPALSPSPVQAACWPYRPGMCFGTLLRLCDTRGEYLVVVFEADEQMFGVVCTCRQRKLEGGGFDGIKFACFPVSIAGFRADEPATVEFVRTWLSFLRKVRLAGRGVGFRQRARWRQTLSIHRRN